MTTLILGASDNPTRFSNRAQRKLLQYGHAAILVNPKGGEIDGLKVYPQLADVDQMIETVTVYINPSYLTNEIDNIIKLNPKRVIFNPGSESAEAAKAFSEQGIQVIEDCTLLMLDGGRY